MLQGILIDNLVQIFLIISVIIIYITNSTDDFIPVGTDSLHCSRMGSYARLIKSLTRRYDRMACRLTFFYMDIKRLL